MSYKSENWKDKLAEVRAYGTFSERKEESIEQSADDILNNEIEEELKSFEEEVVVEEEQLDEFNTKMPEKVRVQILDYMNKLMDLPYGSHKFNQMKKEMEKLQKQYSIKDEVEHEVEETVEETPVKESVEKSIEKLTEKNMLGRLAKQLKLNEQGKQQMFDYFEKGELKQ